ncbi:sulfurtransferase TusA family protein [Spirochaeta thermophila]|nr:sulfurtransferase TusA family protein [Spirochaeta thermophila]
MRRLDITRDTCPMTFVKTKLELEKLKPGEVLEVYLSEGEPLDNVPKTARAQGYEVLDISHVEGGTYLVRIRKRGGGG